MSSTVGDALPARNHNLPPAIVLPERLVHWSGGVIPGVTLERIQGRADLLRSLDQQRRELEQSANVQRYDDRRQAAISLLAAPEIRRAMDVTRADPEVQERYGRNSFGWSLLMAYRLVEAGVNLVQIVIASEFGRTPKLSTLPESYNKAGRDHWGAVQSVFFAGGGVQGGSVIGASDKLGAYPAASPQLPENMAATIYRALGIPPTAVWHDELNRPHAIYYGQPIPGLLT